MPRHLHRNTLGDAGAYQIAHCRSPQIMRNASGHACPFACITPCPAKRLDLCSETMTPRRASWRSRQEEVGRRGSRPANSVKRVDRRLVVCESVGFGHYNSTMLYRLHRPHPKKMRDGFVPAQGQKKQLLGFFIILRTHRRDPRKIRKQSWKHALLLIIIQFQEKQNDKELHSRHPVVGWIGR